MPHTLRSFLESIDNRMLHIREPVDPVKQVGYLCSESRGPLMFHNLEGFPGFRLTDILIKDRRGQAAALGLDDIKEVCPFLAAQMSKGPGKSKMVKDGPVKEVKLIGKDADIRKLPIPIHSKGDAGRYLGSGVTVTKDPDTGLRNESILRVQLTDDPHKAPFWMAARHNYAHYMKYVERNQPMPMAFAIGLHPVYEIMSNWSGRSSTTTCTFSIRDLNSSGRSSNARSTSFSNLSLSMLEVHDLVCRFVVEYFSPEHDRCASLEDQF